MVRASAGKKEEIMKHPWELTIAVLLILILVSGMLMSLFSKPLTASNVTNCVVLFVVLSLLVAYGIYRVFRADE